MTKLPFFSKYPTSRISSLYVFPLIWLRKLFSNPIFHRITAYCEGIVGRFSGLGVKFLGHLKKPVMTKRASLGASSVSDVHTKSARKSPTTSSMTYTEPPSPAPYQLFPQRRESQERRSSSSSQKTSSFVSPSRTLERCGSVLHPLHSPQDRNRLTSPLSHSVICSSSSPPSVTKARDSDEERGGFGLSSMHLLPMSYSPISTLSDSVSTPALAAFSLHAESQDCSNPCTTPFPVSTSHPHQP